MSRTCTTGWTCAAISDAIDTISQIRIIWKPLVFVLCLIPATLVVTDALEVTGGLGANPIEEIQDRFGNWGLRFVLITLAVTPLRHASGRNWVVRFRRMLGLFAFFYALMHFLTWLVLDQGLLVSAIKEDILERPFITIGFVAFLILLAMAATSTNGMRRRLGRRWKQLHYGAYAVGILGVCHYWWQVKLDVRDPLIYAVLLTVLLGIRIRVRSKKQTRARVQASQEQGRAPH